MSSGTSLLDRIIQFIDSGGLELPVFNKTALKLQSLAASDDFDMNEVERLIHSDPVLAAEVLRAANSPFFCGLAPIQTIRNAVVRLSIQQVSRLVILASERSKYQAKDTDLKRRLQSLWQHSSATAMAGQWLARRLNFKNLEDEAFLGGLLHDVGQLVILRAMDELKLAKDSPYDFSSDLVQEVLRHSHTQIGHQMLKQWNVPEVYCRIARDHHMEEFDTTDIPLALVRLANYATAKSGISLTPDPTLVLNALPEAQSLGATDIILAELEIMLEDTIEQVS